MHLCFVCRLPVIFYYLFANCSFFFFSFFLLSGVFLLLCVCMYVLARLKLRWMDLIRWQRRSVLSIFFFFLPFFGKAPSGICVAPTREMGHKSALFVRNVALKGKKKNRPTQRRIFQRDSRQARCSALAHIPASLLCRPLFFYVLYLKKVYSDKQEKKGLQMQN